MYDVVVLNEVSSCAGICVFVNLRYLTGFLVPIAEIEAWLC